MMLLVIFAQLGPAGVQAQEPSIVPHLLNLGGRKTCDGARWSMGVRSTAGRSGHRSRQRHRPCPSPPGGADVLRCV